MCRRFTKIYRRTFNRTMAISLLWLDSAVPDDDHGWVAVSRRAPRWLIRTNQLPSCRWWNLIERQPTETPLKKHSGVWRVTSSGREFVQGRHAIPAAVYTYGGEVVSADERAVSVSDCFENFDYERLMNEIACL